MHSKLSTKIINEGNKVLVTFINVALIGPPILVLVPITVILWLSSFHPLKMKHLLLAKHTHLINMAYFFYHWQSVHNFAFYRSFGPLKVWWSNCRFRFHDSICTTPYTLLQLRSKMRWNIRFFTISTFGIRILFTTFTLRTIILHIYCIPFSSNFDTQYTSFISHT